MKKSAVAADAEMNVEMNAADATNTENKLTPISKGWGIFLGKEKRSCSMYAFSHEKLYMGECSLEKVVTLEKYLVRTFLERKYFSRKVLIRWSGGNRPNSALPIDLFEGIMPFKKREDETEGGDVVPVVAAQGFSQSCSTQGNQPVKGERSSFALYQQRLEESLAYWEENQDLGGSL